MTEKQKLNTKKIEELQTQLNELKNEAKTDASSTNKSVKIFGIISATIIILACFGALGFGIYKYNSSDSNNKSSVTSEQKDYSNKIMNDQLESKEQERKPSNANNSSAKATPDVATDDGIENKSEDKYLHTKDFEFKFQVTDTSKYSIIEEWSEVAGKEYSILVYCYELNDTSFDEDWACGLGKAGIFFISVFDATQWSEYQKGPFGSGATLVGQNNGLYYSLESTEEFVPAELETEIDSILETVRNSFEITGNLDEI